MQKVMLALSGILLGYLLADSLPDLRAQRARNAGPRWEQMCELETGFPYDSRPGAMTTINGKMAARGSEGWELVGTNISRMAYSDGRDVSELLVCYRRPAR